MFSDNIAAGRVANSAEARVEAFDVLRALSVIGVLISHVSGLLPGGFVGVDVFFVISGYLITRSYIGRGERGWSSVMPFFDRRARRIIPPLIFVTVFVFVFWQSVLFYAKPESKELRDALAYQSVFMQNYFFGISSINYFRGLNESKLTLHLWSIAIEEQFYLIFPFMFFILRRKVAYGFVGIIVCTLLIGVLHRENYSYYYYTQARLWELAAGVSTFLLVRRIGKAGGMPLPGWLWRGTGVGAFFGIAYAMTVLTERDVFSALHLGVVFLSCAYLAAADLGPKGGGSVLILPVSMIGKASYSLYLWHWPVYCVIKYIEGDFGFYQYVVYFVSVAFLSVLSFLFVEDAPLFRGVRRPALYLIPAYVLIVYGMASVNTSPLNDLFAPRDKGSLEDLLQSSAATRDYCFHGECEALPNRDFIVLWGDSHAGSLGNEIHEIAEQLGMQVVFVGSTPPNRESTGRRPHSAAAYRHALELRDLPYRKVFIWASRWPFYVDLPEGEPEERIPGWYCFNDKCPKNAADMAEIFDDAFRSLAKDFEGQQVIIVKDVPRYDFFPQKELLMGVLGLKDVRTTQKSRAEYEKDNAAVNPVMDRVAARYKTFQVLDTASALCPQDQCQWHDGWRSFYYDDDHLSLYGVSRLLRPMLESAIRSAVADARNAAPSVSRPAGSAP